MPKRSNDFQKLILHLNKHQLQNTIIKESELLVDSFGIEREVDIFIKSNIGDYQIAISVECTSRSRKADISWVQEMYAKHQDLKTDVLVLVCKSGYTKNAIKEAKKRNILIFDFNELVEISPSNAILRFRNIAIKTLDIKVENVYVYVRDLNCNLIKFVAQPDTLIFNKTGTQNFQIVKIIQEFTNYQEIVQKFLKEGEEKHKHFVIDWHAPKNGVQIFLKKEDTRELHRIERIYINGNPCIEIDKFETIVGRYSNFTVMWGKTIVKNTRFYFVTTDKDKTISFFKG